MKNEFKWSFVGGGVLMKLEFAVRELKQFKKKRKTKVASFWTL